MATFYKYAERNAQSQINWAEVGRNITDTLKEEARLREEKIAAIDENTRQLGLTLENNIQGEHEGLNQWSLDYASKAQQMRLIQDRLLRSGQLNVKDYTKMRQNLSDGTDGIFAALEEYQTEYSGKMERYRNGDSQPLEQWLMAQAEGLANFSEYKPVIDSMSSEVFIAKMKDGKIDEDPNNYLSVSTLRNRIKGKFDRFKTDDYAEKIASGFGVETLEVAKKMGTTWGKIISKEGVRGTVNLSPKDQAAIDAYDIAENAAVSSALTNPYNFTSILSDNGYTFTFNPTEAQNNDKLILLKNDPKNGYPVPDTGATNYKSQMGEADKLLRNIIRSKMDKKTNEKTFGIGQVTPRQPAPKSQGDIAAEANTSMIGRLYTGGQNLQTALDYFRGRLPEGTKINRDGDGITIIDANGNKKKIGFYNTDGTPRNQAQFIEAASSALLDDSESKNVIGLVLKGGYSEGEFDPTTTGSASVQKPKTITEKHRSRVSGIQIPQDSEAASVSYLESQFGAAGFKFEEAGFDYPGSPNKIKITDVDGESQDFETTDAAGIKAFLNNKFNPTKANVSGYSADLNESGSVDYRTK